MSEASEVTNPIERLVSALSWAYHNTFRRVYFVAYTAPSKWKGGMSISHCEVDINGTWGKSFADVATVLAEENPNTDTLAVSITSVQKIGYKVFGKKIYTW